MKSIDKPFIRYLLVGGLNTGFTYILFVLILLFLSYQVAYTLVYVIGIFSSYILNSMIVFQEALHWKKALKYPLVYVVQYLMGLILLTILVETFGLDPKIAAILNILVAVPITFVLSKHIIKAKLT